MAFDKISTTHNERDAEDQPDLQEMSNHAEKEIYQENGAILVALNSNSKIQETGNLKTTPSGHVCIALTSGKLGAYGHLRYADRLNPTTIR